MWSESKRDRCLRSFLLIMNCAACFAIGYIYIAYMDKEGNIDGILSENIIQPEKLTAEKCTPVCDSRACIWHANMLLRNINSSIDPCENFHSFLCSGFQAQFGLDEHANMISETRKPMLTRLKGILDNIHADPGSALGKMKTVYDSCVNYGSSELRGIVEVKNFLNHIGISNWPDLPQDFSLSDFRLPVILGSFIVFGANDYFSLRIEPGNETQQHHFQATFSSSRLNKTTDIPEGLAVSMLKYFDLETEDINAIMEDYELVRKSIVNLAETYECQKEDCDQVYVDCSKQHDYDWLEFCETFAFVLSFKKLDEQYDANTIIIQKPEDMFFKNLYPTLHSFSNRSLANFIALSFIRGYQEQLNFYFRLSKLKQKDFTYDIEAHYYELDRWKYCVQLIADKLKVPLMNEFLHQYLTSSITEEISKAYHDYLSDLSEIVTRQEWIPTESKSNIVESMKNITFNIEILRRVFPNDTYVNKAYEEFHPTEDSFFNNVLQLKNAMHITGSPSDISIEKAAPFMTDFDVQATFGFPFLDIHFGMLLPPFYIPGHKSLINRALLAPILGHEFGHLLFQMLEYNDENDEKFLEKKQCVEDQFSRFKFENLNENLNGSRYSTENFPDNVATTIIDKAIEQYSTSQDIILPGLPYSTKQLLYMSSVQMWCAKSSLEKDLHHKNEDHHAPTEFRLIGIMQNSRGHPEAFHCPAGSYMNPPTKCSLLDT